MNELCRIVIPIDLLPLSRNREARRHKGTLATLHHNAAMAAYVCWTAAGKPTTLPCHWPVTVDVIAQRANFMDKGNVWDAAKHLIDALFKKRITPDDGPEYFDCGRPHLELSPRYKGREQVVFVVRSESAAPVELRGPVSRQDVKEFLLPAGVRLPARLIARIE